MVSFVVATTFGQAKSPVATNMKKDQMNLSNDLYISYGTGTLFYFIDNQGFNATSIRQIIFKFEIPYSKTGRIYFSEKDIRAWLQGGRRQTVQEIQAEAMNSLAIG
ncbi:MAG: hypothetical protein WCK09_19245 [Bacteroidota bacterium]